MLDLHVLAVVLEDVAATSAKVQQLLQVLAIQYGKRTKTAVGGCFGSTHKLVR
tara:strand:+ start:368 stop:526 length:159 start_codon:yes stop_codon:yes gene_type:complete